MDIKWWKINVNYANLSVLLANKTNAWHVKEIDYWKTNVNAKVDIMIMG